MQKQRLKTWVPPAQCGKKSFGTDWDNTVSILRQGPICIALRDVPKHFSLCRMITHFWTATFCSCSFLHVILRPEGQIQSAGDTLHNVRWDSNPRIVSLSGSRCKCSSGIHFGISSCTAVKDGLKHSLEVTLQAYFTILSNVFHGKKAAKIHGAYNFSINRTIICAVLKYSSRFDNRVSQAKTEYFLRQAKSCKKSPRMRAFSLF